MRCINHVLVEPQHQQDVTVITVIRSVTVINTTGKKGTECYMYVKPKYDCKNM